VRHVNLDFYFQTESSGRLSSRCSITNVWWWIAASHRLRRARCDS